MDQPGLGQRRRVRAAGPAEGQPLAARPGRPGRRGIPLGRHRSLGLRDRRTPARRRRRRPTPAGSGSAWTTESVLWLAACDELTLQAGPGWPRPAGGPVHRRPEHPPRCARSSRPAELPHLVSTRDTRDRLDLVTDDVPVGAKAIRADRIIYHPGDTAAAHYHTDCHHVFCVLAGSGLLYTGERGDAPGRGGQRAGRPGRGALVRERQAGGVLVRGVLGAAADGDDLDGDRRPLHLGTGRLTERRQDTRGRAA